MIPNTHYYMLIWIHQHIKRHTWKANEYSEIFWLRPPLKFPACRRQMKTLMAKDSVPALPWACLQLSFPGVNLFLKTLIWDVYCLFVCFFERERERNIDVRNIYQLPPTYAPTRNWTCSLLVHRGSPNPPSHLARASGVKFYLLSLKLQAHSSCLTFQKAKAARPGLHPVLWFCFLYFKPVLCHTVWGFSKHSPNPLDSCLEFFPAGSQEHSELSWNTCASAQSLPGSNLI